ncbi:hypothetical protein [Sulfobacillus harzensis]|uniref:Uncharacterized protein n=1 Tax=Sulfobacillus harzensis TaxID=2729629 RepID=A0A7Y0L7Y9_9FIRM|nr:hypothetical protein [Sulfobacillus harzensis]NMP24673.1 hypothetical protein [Sulfobacillus harzensis]
MFQFATQSNIFLEHPLVGVLQFPDPGFHGRSRFVIHGNALHFVGHGQSRETSALRVFDRRDSTLAVLVLYAPDYTKLGSSHHNVRIRGILLVNCPPGLT